jgi:hypothetical protein
MRDLQRAGIDVAQVTRQLLDEGIEKFVVSLNDILQTIGTRAMIGSYERPPGSADRSNQDAVRRHSG